MRKLTLIKYKNRKLYAKELSGYVALTDIFNFVKSGSEVQVTDHATKQDITKDILKKAWVNGASKLTTQELTNLIRGI